MYANTPVYYPSIKSAREKNELELEQDHAYIEISEKLGGVPLG